MIGISEAAGGMIREGERKGDTHGVALSLWRKNGRKKLALDEFFFTPHSKNLVSPERIQPSLEQFDGVVWYRSHLPLVLADSSGHRRSLTRLTESKESQRTPPRATD